MIVVAVLSSKRPFHECILTWVFYRRYNTSGFMSNDGIYRRSRLARQARLNYNLVHPPPPSSPKDKEAVQFLRLAINLNRLPLITILSLDYPHSPLFFFL